MNSIIVTTLEDVVVQDLTLVLAGVEELEAVHYNKLHAAGYNEEPSVEAVDFVV